MTDDVIDDDLPDDNNDPLASLPDEDRQYARGWKPNDPKGKTLEQFVADGKVIEQIQRNNARIKRIEESEAARREADKAFHEAQLIQLKKEFADAVSMADLGEVTRIQKQIDQSISHVRQTVVQPDLSYAQEWQSRPENKWIFDEDEPKAVYAKSLFDKAIQSGKPAKDAIDEMEYKVNMKFPDNSNDRTPAPKTTTSRTPSGKSGPTGSKLSMKDLNADEKSFVKELRGYFKGTDDEILKMVERARAEQ